MKKDTSLGDKILDRLSDFSKRMKSGEVAKKLNAYTVRLDLCPSEYDADAVKAVRKMLGVSQPIFARVLAVSLSTLRSWEQGHQKPSGPACRLLDRIADDPKQWRSWLIKKSDRRRPKQTV